MKIAYVGNFGPRHSTENHVKQGFEDAGHEIIPIQEGPGAWERVPENEFDFLLWTRTADLDEQTSEDLKKKVLSSLEVPSVGYHLDRWWGLKRDNQLRSGLQFFDVDLLVTADGGHEDMWSTVGINHLWMPPAVSRFECEPGNFSTEFESEITFVGSWQGYHPEWQHRDQLVRFLQSKYGERVKFWPKPGEHAIRNEPLRDLYASVKLVVGDSCLSPGVNNRVMKNYWSDRIPETMGRGAFLIHPETEGLSEAFPYLETWNAYNWEELESIISQWLEDDEDRRKTAALNRDWVLDNHTYTVRANQLIDVLKEKQLL